MRIVIAILIGIHGIIHLFGYFKAFRLFKLQAISQPISKAFGILWFLVFILFVVTLIFYLNNSPYWCATGLIGVISSQYLIINNWQDTKFGSAINLILLLSIIVAYSSMHFKKQVNHEITSMYALSNVENKMLITEQMLVTTPSTIQKWLRNSNIIGKESIQNVSLKQEIQMLMNPEENDWINGQALQYFTTDSPAFNWSVDLKLKSGLQIVGRDKFENGKGEMNIKMLSTIPFVDVKSGEKINQATLQRFLAEIVWFPSASLKPYIHWEEIDEFSAKATMTYKGTIGSGIFHFDEQGNFKKFVAMRFKDVKDNQPTEWTVTATKTEKRNGIKIPVECEVSWKIADKNWTWLKLKITDIKYNVKNSVTPK